jgi:predicted ferric reductase
MSITAATVFGSNPLWYATRATGVVAFVLLTASFALGLAATKRALASKLWPRFATQHLHRNIALLAVGFLCVHILTSLADSFVTVGWWSWIIPGVAGYRPFWVALGTLAFDIAIVLAVTSLVRDRMSARVWRGIHLSAYAAWPLAFLHFIGTGTDAAHGRWGVYLAVACLFALGIAGSTRWLTSDAPSGPLRSVRGSLR